MRTALSLGYLLLALPFGTQASAGSVVPSDPLGSVQWETMYSLYLSEHPVVFDQTVVVTAPESAEDSLAVPVMIDASALENVERIVVFADLNPLPKILEYHPGTAYARLGFRFKVQQATPIRAAALTTDGVWHVGHTWLEAAGGGCTLPSLGSGAPEWESRLGEVRARTWATDGRTRLKFSVIHPMDTGLAPGIPVFHIESISIADGTRELARIDTYEPVSENPLFALDLPNQGPFRVSGVDNNGNRFTVDVE